MIRKPPCRKLRGYAFDPSLSLKVDTALINNITYKIPWEEDLRPGPRGEYIEVMDYDPTVGKWYAPVDLNQLYIAAQDGIEPSSSNPQFHQQMVYAVAMTTIKNFEAALGRPVLWSPRHTVTTQAPKKKAGKAAGKPEQKQSYDYVPVLRIYPHALRDANAYYSPQKKALLFGYFAARPADITLQMPDNLTFTCLSHDIIAHETTHAILDGLYRKYTDNTNPDVLAFHEAFSDIVALFQHFTFPDVLKSQIAATRGDLASQNLLGKLAQEFGIAIGNYGALRDAIGSYDRVTGKWAPKVPDGDEYRKVMEPHARGAILVSAVFEAFLNIYKVRVADLLRIASNGTGILPQGELQPDLVNRLAAEAAKTAGHVLKMCIRALDFCPPVDITFGDFLRAIITADADLVADDSRDYRLMFIDAFRRRGIYPTGIKNLSVESLSYPIPNTTGMEEQIRILTSFLREFRAEITYAKKREAIYAINRKFIAGDYTPGQEPLLGLHRRLSVKFRNSKEFELLTGLVFGDDYESLGIAESKAYKTERPSFQVHSLHFATRISPSGNQTNQVVVTLLQNAAASISKDKQGNPRAAGNRKQPDLLIGGGCTLIFDLDTLELKYAISKPLLDVEALANSGVRQLHTGRAIQIRRHLQGKTQHMNAYQAYFGMAGVQGIGEPFAFLHTH
ncbi:MAG: hypothetical protein P0Y53_03235 [Candidatus Pseudobacter hemicellulosilyticus]|uniref:Peptidase M4 n=1 Tax=Candidatus Pseudobacter hemicellulosilyticus TaxID=3121375 RepID=A0AAJ5WTX3_9BACT|nr:MAG: hypothetical protein P0Y53_03235 [Pseudobacter sp.]